MLARVLLAAGISGAPRHRAMASRYAERVVEWRASFLLFVLTRCSPWHPTCEANVALACGDSGVCADNAYCVSIGPSVCVVPPFPCTAGVDCLGCSGAFDCALDEVCCATLCTATFSSADTYTQTCVQGSDCKAPSYPNCGSFLVCRADCECPSGKCSGGICR
jgi:hypothetical protein